MNLRTVAAAALAICLSSSLIACGGDDALSGDDAGSSRAPDAGALVDAAPATPDASPADAGNAGDAGELSDAQPDAAPVDAGTDAADAEAPLTILAVSPNVIPVAGGLTLTITGTGFTGATSVAVYGVSVVPFVVVNDSTITLVTSPLAPAYDAGDAGDSIGGDYPLVTGVVVYKGDAEAETTALVSLGN